MWTYNNDYNRWEEKKDILNLDDFQYFKQEFDSFRFYSKCLSGSSYVPVNDTSNIYDILSDYKPRNWYIGNTASQYSTSFIPTQYANPINQSSSDEYYNKYNFEYGLTLKNLFTPERIIKDSIDNFIYVDVVTTEQLIDLNEEVDNRQIDGVRLKDGQRVLVKDQKTTITLSNLTDPNDFFEGEFDRIEVVGTNIVYEYYNEDNGIYRYSGNLLIREDDLNDYEKCVRFSVVSKLGDVNNGKQFHLSRLLNGYYPTTSLNQPLLFKEKKNWIIRNQIDYNNLFDINYYDVIKHGTQSYFFEGVTYSIPERVISIGEFGVIINHQSGSSNIIRNKYKVNLRSIDQTEKYYWVVGDNGILLKIRKHDFEIERIQVDCKCPSRIVTTNLRSISFFNDLNGVAVGDINTILITNDGGLTWDRNIIEAFNAYYFNSVLFKELNNFYVAGNNGVFVKFERDSSGWTAYKRRISKFIDDEDEFLLVENINSILPVKIDSDINPWDVNYRFGGYTSNPDKDLLVLTTDNNNIIVHDVDDSIPFHTDFMYLEFRDKNYTDIKSIERKENTNEFYFTGFDQSSGDSGIFSFNLDDFSTISIGSSFSNRILSTFSATFESNYNPNSMFDYNGDEFYIAGNNSLLQTSTYSATFSFDILDDSFESNLKSKLLFLDYDIAGKLNFFTDDGEYRLPNSVEFELNLSNGSHFGFKPITFNTGTPSFLTQSEINWWKYWQDSDSTFEYYATSNQMSDLTKVEPSGEFYYDSNTDINVNSVTIDPNDILNLAPSILDEGHSRFSGESLTDISEPQTSYDLYLYDYLMVIRYNSNFSVNTGDMIRLESDEVEGEFLVNKVININGDSYAYLFTEFSDGVLKSLSTSNSIVIKNLNSFSNASDLEYKFNLHPISNGYELSTQIVKKLVSFSLLNQLQPNNATLSINNSRPIINSSILIQISAKFNNITSYYNLSTDVYTSIGETHSMQYESSFTKFGYKPTYNILDYLEYLNDSLISPQFFANKEYLAMPVYNNIPISSESNLSLLGENESTFDRNKIIFGKNLEFEWNSLFLNTFVDISLRGNETYNTEKLLIIDKYYDEIKDVYIIEFHDQLKTGNEHPNFIDIISRRTLLQISDDLQYLNNIQRPYRQKDYKTADLDVSYQTLEKDLNFKVNTDSYAKVLLSDYNTIRLLSGLIYTDYKGELSMNITQLESKNEIEILNTSNFSGNLFITCKDRHNLSTGDGVVLEFNGGENSSEELNNQYFGYHIVTYVNEFSFYVDVPYGSNVLVGNDTGIATYVKRDPFLNYQAVDIIDVGVDKRGKISVELTQDNTTLNGDIYSLIDVNYEKYRFRLIDGLDIERLAINYSWIYEAEISEAVIGLNDEGLVWYKGIWECGRWFGGTWVSGSWISGDWYGGNWKSKLIKDNYITIEFDERYTDNSQSIWFSGRWFDGNWEAGTWASGRWYDGTWNDGIWLDGIWNDGIWKSGQFTGGVWVLGDWESGIFSTLNAPAYWIDGTWLSGDFENGMWFNGVFGTSETESRFGTKAYNSRAAIWKSGNWINGSFHSRLNLDENNNPDVSDIHKYSIWETGNWFNGDFYGGVVYNMDFKSGIWHGGILEDVTIIGMRSSDNNYFEIEGESPYNIGYEISIIDNQTGGSYSSLGSNSSPGTYTVVFSTEDLTNNTTKIYVDKPIPYNVTTYSDTGLRLVSKFRNCNWKSGIWTNGLYEKGLWEGGIWYNGVFSGTWM